MALARKKQPVMAIRITLSPSSLGLSLTRAQGQERA